jgi:hypothetical protein
MRRAVPGVWLLAAAASAAAQQPAAGGEKPGADAVASVRDMRALPGLTLFDRRNFAGSQQRLERDEPQMQFTARSARIVGGRWRLCERPFFGGRCVTVDRDQPTLDLPRAFGGMVRSAKPEARQLPTSPHPAPPPDDVRPAGD